MKCNDAERVTAAKHKIYRDDFPRLADSQTRVPEA